MEASAVVFQEPEHLALRALALTAPTAADVVVEIDWSGISTGTERLLWSGRMPSFPGFGYPLVPGYESVGRVVDAGSCSERRVGDTVFVPGANCFGPVRGLFGGAASRLVLPGRRAVPVAPSLGRDGVLLALAATARHIIADRVPELIVGHGVLGRLVARLAVLAGGAPVVWETEAARRHGDGAYPVIDPEADTRHDYAAICDVSGDDQILDRLMARLVRGGEIVLGGFYAGRMSFAFPPAFMREARVRVAAEWRERDLSYVSLALAEGRLSLAGLLTHSAPAADAADAYRTAFGDPACLKMVLEWSGSA